MKKHNLKELSNIFNCISLVFVLLSFLITYYYFNNLNYHSLLLALFIFEFGLSLKIGCIISSIIITHTQI